MKTLLLILALCAAVSAIPYKFDHDIKINVYDVFKSLYAAAPLKYYSDLFAKGKEVKFREDTFHFYPEEEFRDVVVVYKPKGKHFLHGYYFRSEDVSKYSKEFFDTVRPIYDYLNSGEYYAFTPLAAKEIVPEYFNTPLRKLFYNYYHDVDLKSQVPWVFLVPKSEVHEAALEDFVLIAEYEVTKDGSHDIHEYFENAGKPVQRRDSSYLPTYYSTEAVYPYTYSPIYYNPYVRNLYTDSYTPYPWY